MTDVFLFRNAIRDLLRPKRLVPAVLLFLLPAAAALVVKAASKYTVDAGHLYDSLALNAALGFSLVILSVVFATGVIAQEQEQKTIVYLLTRPLPRWRILMAKYAAAVCAIVATVWGSLVLLEMVTVGPRQLLHSGLGTDLKVVILGALAYGGLFLLLATFARAALIIGLLFGFGWETLVPQFPGMFKMVSLMSYVRGLSPHKPVEHDSMEIREALGSFLATNPITPTLSWIVLVATAVLCTFLAVVLFSTREYVPREDL